MAKTSPVRKTIKIDHSQIISRVRELAWTGQHAQAIDLASQELSKADWQSAPRQMDLLDLRAESYIAQLNFDAAEKDVKQMERLAKVIDKPAWKAQALIRKAQLRAWQGKEDDRKRAATSALK